MTTGIITIIIDSLIRIHRDAFSVKLLAKFLHRTFLLRAFFRYVARVFAFTNFEVTATLRMFVVV